MPATRIDDRSPPPLPHEELFGHIMDVLTDGVLAKDADGRYFYVNHAAAAILGKTPLEVLGRTDRELFEPEFARKQESTDREALGPGKEPSFESMPFSGGSGKRLLFRKSLLRSRSGQPIGILTMVREVASRPADERPGRADVETELERLRELDRIKTQFINHTAHELSTPLTPIKLQMHLLKTLTGRQWSDQERRSFEILERNFERLATLVGDVLDASRLQAGRLGVQRQPLDVGPLVQEAYESFRALYDQNKIRFECECSEGLFVDGDPMRLTQVLFNYLHNAQKFTAAGGAVKISAKRHGDKVAVEVRDNGSGLTGEQIENLFQPFSQVHDTNEKTRAGTGLGLFISRGIIELHGGKVEVTSDGPGKGSRFVFELPARDAPSGRAATDVTRAMSSLVKNEFQRRVQELV